jgi:hypothetical protein
VRSLERGVAWDGLVALRRDGIQPWLSLPAPEAGNHAWRFRGLGDGYYISALILVLDAKVRHRNFVLYDIEVVFTCEPDSLVG